tara:strand:+ start:346 stop:753 length:408 start_codon:yes stop_codon:yes gene_type:complete
MNRLETRFLINQDDIILNNISRMINDFCEYQRINNIYSENNYDIRLDIEIDLDDSIKENNYFLNCKHINSVLQNYIYIKKDDDIIGKKCLICMDEFKHKEYKRILPGCKHYFHKKCIDKWLKKNSTCPICRQELL